MSTDLLVNDRIVVTRFWGGEKQGTCVQLTGRDGFVQFNMEELNEVINVLKEARLINDNG